MKSRIITGVVGAALTLVVLLVLPPIALNIAMAFLCGIAMYEILHVAQVQHVGLSLLSILFAASAPFLLLAKTYLVALAVILLYMVALGIIQVFSHETLRVEQTGFVFMMSMLVPISLSCMAYFRGYNPQHGLFYIFLALIIAWMCDIGAFFIGTFCGRHKLCPSISPKKTVEGLIGGIVVSIFTSLLASWLYTLLSPVKGTFAICYWQIALLAFVGSLLSVVGDLFASVIKRGCRAKDFGHIIPGHGGVMDRFDSLLFVTPALYLVVHVWPLAVPV